MAKKGRPFTYQSDDDRPVTLSVRLPAALTDLVKRYAAAHGQMPISELIREGLEWRIGDGDPRGMGMYLREPTDRSKKSYDCNTGIASAPQGEGVLQEVHALLARQWEQIQTLAQALERQKVLASDGVYSSNTTMTATAADISHDNNTVIQKAVPKRRSRKMPANVLQEAQNPALAEEPTSVAQTHNGNTVLQETAPKRPGRKPVLRAPILALLREYPNGLTAAQLKVYLDTEKPIGDTLAGMVKAALLVKDGSGKAVRYLLADAALAPSRP